MFHFEYELIWIHNGPCFFCRSSHWKTGKTRYGFNCSRSILGTQVVEADHSASSSHCMGGNTGVESATLSHANGEGAFRVLSISFTHQLLHRILISVLLNRTTGKVVTNIRKSIANGTTRAYGAQSFQEMHAINAAAGFGPTASAPVKIFSEPPFVCPDPAPPPPPSFKFGTGVPPSDLSATQRPCDADGGSRLAFFGGRAPALKPGEQLACDLRLYTKFQQHALIGCLQMTLHRTQRTSGIRACRRACTSSSQKPVLRLGGMWRKRPHW